MTSKPFTLPHQLNGIPQPLPAETGARSSLTACNDDSLIEDDSDHQFLCTGDPKTGNDLSNISGRMSNSVTKIRKVQAPQLPPASTGVINMSHKKIPVLFRPSLKHSRRPQNPD